MSNEIQAIDDFSDSKPSTDFALGFLLQTVEDLNVDSPELNKAINLGKEALGEAATADYTLPQVKAMKTLEVSEKTMFVLSNDIDFDLDEEKNIEQTKEAYRVGKVLEEAIKKDYPWWNGSVITVGGNLNLDELTPEKFDHLKKLKQFMQKF